MVTYFGRLSLQSPCLLFLLADPFSSFSSHVCLPVHASKGSAGAPVLGNAAFKMGTGVSGESLALYFSHFKTQLKTDNMDRWEVVVPLEESQELGEDVSCG